MEKNTIVKCADRENCKKECNLADDMLACEAVKQANPCPVCKRPDKLNIHNVTNPGDNFIFIFVRCACGFGGNFHRQFEPEVSKLDYIKAVDMWNNRS